MKLFICSTPFQIITAINIVVAKYNSEKVDMYILDHSPECYKYYSRLKNIKVFNEVYFFKTREAYICHYKNKVANFLNYGKKAYNALNYKWLENKIPNKHSFYEKIYIAYPDLPTQILYYSHKKNNINIELNFFEEGVFTYSAFSKKWSWLRVIYSKKLFGSFILDDCTKVLSYQPTLIRSKNYNFKKELIPKLDKNNTLLIKILNSLIKDDNNERFRYRYIYFDQPFELESVKDKQEQLINSISKTVGTENLGLKIHPRNNGSYNLNYNIINSRIPFELTEINYDMNNKVLISLYSTACLNPKIIFDEEPFVILLFKLVSLPELDANVFEIALDVQNIYSNKNRFFIPESQEELVRVLKYIENIND